MTGVTTRRAESKTECRGKRQALEADPSKNPKPSRARVYARIMLACARYASAGHYLINTTKALVPYLAGISAFLGEFKNLRVFCELFRVQSGMLNTLLRGYYGSSPLPLF